MPKQLPSRILMKMSVEQGWTKTTELQVVLDFLDENVDASEFSNYLELRVHLEGLEHSRLQYRKKN